MNPLTVPSTDLHLHPFSQLFQPDGLALPHNQHSPASRNQGSMNFRVTFHVLSEFLQPECGIGLRRRRVPASLVAMPEASLDEYSRLIPGEDNIRFSRQVTPVQPESETESVKH